MRKFIVPAVAICLCCVLSLFSVLQIRAEVQAKEIPDDALVTYGVLQEYKEQLKQEILQELSAGGGMSQGGDYADVTATKGQFIYLHQDTEVIYRGGGGVVITSASDAGEGIKDMSEGTELFSGRPLEYGHIYYSADSQSKKAILITGEKAYFTVKGQYEIG